MTATQQFEPHLSVLDQLVWFLFHLINGFCREGLEVPESCPDFQGCILVALELKTPSEYDWIIRQSSLYCFLTLIVKVGVNW